MSPPADKPSKESDVVLRMFEAIARQDLEAALAALHPEVVWSPTVWSGSSRLRGRDAVRAWFTQFGSSLQHLRIEVSELRQPAGWVIVCGLVHDTREVSFTTRVGWNFAVRDGLVIEGRAFQGWAEAVRAGGG